MALTFSVETPGSTAVSKGRSLFNFQCEQQYFEMDYVGAVSGDKITVDEQQDGTNWTNLATITISSSGSGTIKDVIGDFKLNGNPMRIVAKNGAGNTTYLTRSYSLPEVKDEVKKDFARQLDDLFIHEKKSNVVNKASYVYRPAFTESLALLNAENNAIVTSTTLTSAIDMSTYNLDNLPLNLQMSIRRNPTRVYINGMNIKSNPQSSNSDFHGDGSTVSPTVKPFFIADGKVHLFAADSNDGGLLNGTKFLQILKSSMGKRLYHAERLLATTSLTKAVYLNQKTTYATIASAKTTELF